jgi:hypothetical protein
MEAPGGFAAALVLVIASLATPAAGLNEATAPDAHAILRDLPSEAADVPAWTATQTGASMPAGLEPAEPDRATERVHAVGDPSWRTWLLELDEVRRTLAAAAPGQGPVQAGPALVAWEQAIETVGRLPASTPATPGPQIDECGTIRVDAAGEDSTPTCDYLLEVDLGGNDTYENNAGGSLSPSIHGPFADVAAGPSALAVDRAGDDTYRCSVDEGGCTGGGRGAAGALFDLGGDDTYHGEGFFAGVNGGAGDWGAGLLVDRAGDDEMTGTVGHGGINGGASFGGAGLLVDRAGDDVHQGTVRFFGGVNGGANDGVGVLADLGGADERSGSVGLRGGVNAGGEQALGVLLDRGRADDRYAGTVDGGGVNGAGNGNQVGYVFVDEGGDDTYQGEVARHGAVNGAISYDGEASFVDGGGSDRYEAHVRGPGAANGAGIGGTGTLVDRAGDDTYRAHVEGAGAANGAAHHGVGMLADAEGEDSYEATVEDGQPHALWGSGAATNGEATAGVGLLLDPDRPPANPLAGER